MYIYVCVCVYICMCVYIYMPNPRDLGSTGYERIVGKERVCVELSLGFAIYKKEVYLYDRS